MKKNQRHTKQTSSKGQTNRSFLNILKGFNGIKGNFVFDIFQYLRLENQKLQIIYANIRV